MLVRNYPNAGGSRIRTAERGAALDALGSYNGKAFREPESGLVVSGAGAHSRVSRVAFQQVEKGGARSSRRLLRQRGDIFPGPTIWARESPFLGPLTSDRDIGQHPW